MPSPFIEKVEELAKLGKARVAFGLLEPKDYILESLRKSKEYADIVLVGPPAISGIDDFELEISKSPEERIAQMLAGDEVDAMVRGTLDDWKTREAYMAITNEVGKETPLLFRTGLGQEFFLVHAANSEGWSKEKHLEGGELTAQFVSKWGIEPNIAVLSSVRHDTFKRKGDITEGVQGILNQTYRDAQWTVSELIKKGFDAKNWSVDLNVAVESGANIVIPQNGMVGNQIMRGIFLGGGLNLAGTLFGFSRIFEDVSRTEKDFSYHIKWVTALANKRKQKES